MTYALEISPHLNRKLKGMERRDQFRLELIGRKVDEILADPHHFKPLRKPLHGWRRVHIDSNFVLTFSINEESKTVVLEDYEHHDKIYRN